MELWDAYNRDFKKIQGITLIRGEAIPEGFFHLVCDIIVRRSNGSYLIMQRDKRKHLGGMWEATAGGSALQGEDALTCARRELHEETGICQFSSSIKVRMRCVANSSLDIFLNSSAVIHL